jgi:hypothetical protein
LGPDTKQSSDAIPTEALDAARAVALGEQFHVSLRSNKARTYALL